MREGVKFVEGKPNPKRRAAKKARGMGLGFVDPTGEGGQKVLDAWCQSKDPLFKVKGKERYKKLKIKIIYG